MIIQMTHVWGLQINELARRYPGLMSLRSVDLSPASWMAVAWYPIYHIPMGRTIKDLSTCFLTYHTLSSSFQGTATTTTNPFHVLCPRAVPRYSFHLKKKNYNKYKSKNL